MTTITALPTPPTRQDPTNFATRGDAFMAALPTFATQVNAVAGEVNANAAICLSAAQTVNVSAWVSGTTYAAGDNRYDTTNFLTYRRKTAGAGTTRPGLDGTNWALLTGFGDADLASNQTFTGVKTFSQTISGSINGNAATVTGGVYTSGNQTVGGTKTFSSTVHLADGGIKFASDGSQDTGLEWVSDGVMRVLCNAVEVGRFNSTGWTGAVVVSTAQVQSAMAGGSTGAVGTYAFCRGAQFSPGSNYSGASLHYTGGVVETIAQSVGSGTWKAMGYTSATDRGTLMLRIA